MKININIICLYKVMIIYGYIKGKRWRHWLILDCDVGYVCCNF